MNSAFRIRENLYIETSKNSVFPLVPAGRKVPATWEQTFTTYIDDQRSFDLHLLFGRSDTVIENSTLGKWRVAGIPPSPKGKHQIYVKIRVGVDGSVGLSAVLNNQPLPIILLTEAFPKIPLTSRVPSIPLKNLIQQLCTNCKSSFVVRAENWKKEPFALCLDCGDKFELSDTPVSSYSAPWDDLPPELVKTLGIEPPHTPGGLSIDELQEIQNLGFDVDIPGQIGFKRVGELTPDEILRLAGNPLPENERRNCPNCDAVVSLESTRCEWCGKAL
jgi:hypothetical protein